MEFTAEQQAEINKLIEDAKTKATEGLFTKEQLDSEIVKAKEGLFDEKSISKRIQSETDKVITEYTKKVKAIEDELIKYKPAEKSETEKALEQREAEIAKKEKMFKVKESLTQNGLPADFYDVIYGELEDEGRITKLAETVNNIVLDGSFKGSKKHNKTTAITKEQFKAMNYNDRAKLFQENPTLYAELSK